MLNAPAPHWIVVGDLHGNTTRLAEIPELSDASGIIVTGDITTLGCATRAREVIEQVAVYHPNVLAQIGNMDRPEVSAWLDDVNINLHKQTRELTPDVAIMGLGGSTFTPFGTPSEFPESHLAEWLESMWVHARLYRHAILISHTPPRDTLCDIIDETTHVGSMAVREFIMDCQPAVCLCGHIHESRATDRLGKTVVVNPGSLSSGGYAVLTLGETEPTVVRYML